VVATGSVSLFTRSYCRWIRSLMLPVLIKDRQECLVLPSCRWIRSPMLPVLIKDRQECLSCQRAIIVRRLQAHVLKMYGLYGPPCARKDTED
jgi:hypothetical protein